MDSQTKAALVAFQRRFRPGNMDGVADDETRYQLMALARGVTRK
jgi:N-acetyl-anhydromuramyl-L-alanine amidase AmpD